MFNIAVLASTNGTDLQAIIDEIKSGNMPGINLSIVISNKKYCFALKRAKDQGFKTKFIDPKGLKRETYDQKIAKILRAENVDLICLIGYMRILSEEFVKTFPNKIINVHPALLPKYGGKNFYGKSVHEAVLAAGDKESGMTIHYVDEGVDTGKIILQKKCKISSDETPDSLKEKIQALEKKYYPEVIRQLAAAKDN